jgi:tetratricopeptide (TPR) repeat protein
MRTDLVGWPHRLLAGLVLGLLVPAGPGRADQENVQRASEDEAALQRRALALNNVTGDDPIKGEIRALAKDAAGTKKLLAVALKMTKQKDQPFSYNGAFILARTAAELKDLDTAKAFYRICIDQAVKLFSGEKLARSYEGLITLLTLHQKHDEVAKVCQEFLELPEEGNLMRPVQKLRSAVIIRMIQSLARAGHYEQAHKFVDGLLEGQPDRWAVLELRGFVQREAGEFDKAAKTYETVKDLVSKDKELTEDERGEEIETCRYILSSVYVDLKKVDKAAEQLKALLANKPDDPTYNNDLGYIWADHDMNLEEAERLIRKALEEDRKQRRANRELDAEDDRDNAAYLDSMGWVLFKRKKYQEAKKYLLQAVEERDGQHIEILDHLADTHMALGEKKEAEAVWKKALEIEARDHRERQRKTEVEKKLKGLTDDK